MVGFLVSNDNLPAHGAAEGGSGEAMNPVVFSNNIRVQQSGERLWLLRPEDGSATCALEKACFHFLTAERAFHNEPPKFHPGPPYARLFQTGSACRNSAGRSPSLCGEGTYWPRYAAGGGNGESISRRWNPPWRHFLIFARVLHVSQVALVGLQVLLALGDLGVAHAPPGAVAIGHGLGQDLDVEQHGAVLHLLGVLKGSH